jgi:hypothetical protein
MKYLISLLAVSGSSAFSPFPEGAIKWHASRLCSSAAEETTGNPCWQDIYDDDCSMSNIAAAGFVASQWIKGMPCAAGIEVSLFLQNAPIALWTRYSFTRNYILLISTNHFDLPTP